MFVCFNKGVPIIITLLSIQVYLLLLFLKTIVFTMPFDITKDPLKPLITVLDGINCSLDL